MALSVAIVWASGAWWAIKGKFALSDLYMWGVCVCVTAVVRRASKEERELRLIDGRGICEERAKKEEKGGGREG